MAEQIQVEVVYGLVDKQRLLTVNVPEGTTMLEAAKLSGITGHFPGLELENAPMGVFGKAEPRPAQRVLKDGERVEIYRPLIIDPKDNRKARAKQAKERRAAE